MNRIKQQPTYVNIICTIQKISIEITIDIEKRDQLHWRLVRVIVCSLWRSKLVSTSSSSSSQFCHTNTLSLIFDDGVVITLKEREIAAPCEYQLLTALIQEIDRYHESHESQPPQSTKPQKLTDNSSDNSGWSKNKLAKRLVNEVL